MLTSNVMVFLTVLTFLLIWVRNERVWQFSYFVLFATGLITGVLSIIAVIPMVALAGLLIVYRGRGSYSLISGLLALVIGLALGLHVVPGFNNYEFASDIKLSAGAAGFDIWFNFDKSMFGLFVLGIVLHSALIRKASDLSDALKLFLPVAAGGILLIYGVGVVIGYSTFDWTPALIFLPWALKNIVFTVLAEEVFFRGIVQKELASRLPSARSGDIAVVVAGVLFGVAHFGGGIYYVLLSSLAGILYGYTYKITGRIEAPIITHFALNAGHFLLFTYPYSVV